MVTLTSVLCNMSSMTALSIPHALVDTAKRGISIFLYNVIHAVIKAGATAAARVWQLYQLFNIQQQVCLCFKVFLWEPYLKGGPEISCLMQVYLQN